MTPKERALRPIFLVGPGRTGSTLLHHALALHPDLAWISSWTGRAVALPQLALGSRLNQLRPLEVRARNARYWPRPSEAYRFWDRHIPGFSTVDHDLGPDEVSSEAKARLRKAIQSHARWQIKRRFITKYTGWPRFELIRSVFPDAILVHLERHPAAVAYSYMNKGWRWNDLPKKRFDRLGPGDKLNYYARRYLAYYDAKRASQEPFIQIRYEDMVADLRGFITELAARLQLPLTPPYSRFLDSLEVRRETNRTWENELDPGEAGSLRRVLARPISEMGYDT